MTRNLIFAATNAGWGPFRSRWRGLDWSLSWTRPHMVSVMTKKSSASYGLGLPMCPETFSLRTFQVQAMQRMLIGPG